MESPLRAVAPRLRGSVSKRAQGTRLATVIDKMIDLARAAAEGGAPDNISSGTGAGQDHIRQDRACSKGLSPEAWRTMRHAMARLAVDLVSSPAVQPGVLPGVVEEWPEVRIVR